MPCVPLASLCTDVSLESRYREFNVLLESNLMNILQPEVLFFKKLIDCSLSQNWLNGISVNFALCTQFAFTFLLSTYWIFPLLMFSKQISHATLGGIDIMCTLCSNFCVFNTIVQPAVSLLNIILSFRIPQTTVVSKTIFYISLKTLLLGSASFFLSFISKKKTTF